MPKNLSKKILDSIKEKKLYPRPKWQFLLRENVVWALGVASLIIGGLATSVIIFMVRNNDWDVYPFVNKSLFGFIITTLPYFWIIFLLIFVFIAHYQFKHTKHGYKYRLHTIVIASILISLVLGVFWHNIGIAKRTDQILQRRFPLYQQLHHRRDTIWMKTERGLLGGEIIDIQEGFIQLKDLAGKEWTVSTNRNDIFFGIQPQKGQKVRILGKATNGSHFEAVRIMPWTPHFFDGRMKLMMNERIFPPQRITE